MFENVIGYLVEFLKQLSWEHILITALILLSMSSFKLLWDNLIIKNPKKKTFIHKCFNFGILSIVFAILTSCIIELIAFHPVYKEKKVVEAKRIEAEKVEAEKKKEAEKVKAEKKKEDQILAQQHVGNWCEIFTDSVNNDSCEIAFFKLGTDFSISGVAYKNGIESGRWNSKKGKTDWIDSSRNVLYYVYNGIVFEKPENRDILASDGEIDFFAKKGWYNSDRKNNTRRFNLHSLEFVENRFEIFVDSNSTLEDRYKKVATKYIEIAPGNKVF